MHDIIVIGGNFAGLTSALELKRKLKNRCRVTIISKSPNFLFTPSLIWVPFSKRTIKDITVPLKPITNKAQVKFICSEVTKILPEERIIQCNEREFKYDYLIIATGPEWMFNQIDGLSQKSNVSFIVTPMSALETRRHWQIFTKHPGPVVIGAAPGAQCSGPAYEFLFNFEKRCRDAGIRKKVDLTFITPEPYLGHLGIGGVTGSRYLLNKLFPLFQIKYITNAEIQRVADNHILLNNRQSLPYKFCLLMPVFDGVQAIKNSPGLGNSKGLLSVNSGYQHKTYPNIFAVGTAADYPVKFKTRVPIGIPPTGYSADVAAKTAAENITRLINGEHHYRYKPLPKIPDFCILDAGDKEFLSLADNLLKPRKFSIVLPNPIYNVGKLSFEKYYLWKVKNGFSWLP